MDRKKINEEISEIRSLMNLNEELPYMSPVGPNPGIGLWQDLLTFFQRNMFYVGNYPHLAWDVRNNTGNLNYILHQLVLIQ